MTQGVEFNRLMLQMRTMQMEAMGKPQPVAKVEQNVNAPAFDDMLKQAVDRVNELQKTTGELRTGYERGDQGIDLTEVMIASQKSSVAFQAITQVRNKMVSAYEDIMKMPI
ncbi:flagellar hook-basal body complex protein FliE [Pseudomonas neustonica]|uniref:Flagellar hook-basal body complex protein FliE n=1 Tax=Pseudomonas neustonica TaxID=2487346 RepID=A0ABX9XQQ3_9PSED|nr:MULTISPECIES: flagellar hook-basal body complex protein FliE [Pseudomonas]MAB24516.1 flagellar hook-basal body complex protein FliE [Pseudomonadales bacterium]MBA6420354.1 flagellar hook-basal body complex protein FliE [Pseudomonas sp. 5Ae-yellow]ROZ87047.1 flagellar hook-basal body complex protein FliE [Pseudomonas sp. SSM44]ROZ88337.1 flagellar hook-basal body complex protein FliE [Pseudomonas neustonica]|tara:strand:+ start:2420 stop:2752 length:333 start_codon:yes stop_codon:yes gene_type:complete